MQCLVKFIYTIQPGDTIYLLANRFQTSVDLILQMNPGIVPRELWLGQQIVICPGSELFLNYIPNRPNRPNRPVRPVPPIGTLPPTTPVPPIGTLPPTTPVPPIGTLPPTTPVPPIGTLPPTGPFGDSSMNGMPYDEDVTMEEYYDDYYDDYYNDNYYE